MPIKTTPAEVSKKAIELFKEQTTAAMEPYVVLRHDYNYPYYYTRGYDYEIQSRKHGRWLLLLSENFFELWPLSEVRSVFCYVKGVWVDSRRSRERNRIVIID